MNTMAMTLDKLKKMLAAGTIDQDDYKDMLEKYGLKEEPEDDPLKDLNDAQKAAVQKMIQSERDRATNKLGNDKKVEIEELRKQLEELKKEKLTESERAELDRKNRETELEKKERAFRQMQNKYTATQALQSAGLENGEDIVSLVLGDTEESTKKNVAALSALVERLVKAKVAEKFKEGGREPGKGSSGGTEDNPWAEGHVNYTKQMEIEARDPEKAKQLRAAAGIK